MIRKRSSRSAPSATLPRKPRVLVAGEFSTGKTFLINELAGDDVLPSNVTATALPSVWLVHGEPALMKVDARGQGLEIESLAEVDADETHYCILSHPSPILEHFHIIDTPGNSDPNMSAESWQRMLGFADLVVWCTNATQAWRQSEKAVWNAMPARLKLDALLVVTHADLLTDPRDAEKVRRRVEREAAPFFEEIRMASLLDRADIDGLSKVLSRVTSEMGEGTGSRNELVESFVASHAPAPGKKRSGPVLPLIWPRRAKGSAAHAATQDSEGGAIVPLRTPAQDCGTTAGAKVGPARAAWENASRGIDKTDPKALLNAVEALIAALDAPQAQPSGPRVGGSAGTSQNRAGREE
ncbi:MAG: dynamin family protein [Pseudomonadota bacterium]